MIWFLQIAQLSTTISATTERKKKKKKMRWRKLKLGFRRGLRDAPQAHRATAFHFLISNRLGFLLDEGPALLEGSPAGTIVTSESRVAILQRFKLRNKTCPGLHVSDIFYFLSVDWIGLYFFGPLCLCNYLKPFIFRL